MKKKFSLTSILVLVMVLFIGCSSKSNNKGLEDGSYLADFTTDSSMFHVNEAKDNKGDLTVKNGNMTIHISLPSKNILNLYPGLAKDVEDNKDKILEPTVDTVTYSDGVTEEVNGFDVPVPVIGEEFDLALVGKKGKWYDHKVVVSNPTPLENSNQASQDKNKTSIDLENGEYNIGINFEGGSGKAKISSPVLLTVSGYKITAKLTWSSPNYDYMIVDGEKYLPINSQGNSVFEIPVTVFDKPVVS